MAPMVPPAVRVTAIVAGGKAQVELPLRVKVNFTGTTPRLTVNTLVPLALIGCWIVAWYGGFKTTNGLNDDTVPQIVFVTASLDEVTLTRPFPLLWNIRAIANVASSREDNWKLCTLRRPD